MLFPHPIRADQGKREIQAYFKLSFIHALARQYKLEVIHGSNFRMKIGKDLMRTFVKYLENQGLSTLKTQRRFYIMGFEAMKNENGGKQERFKYYFFDKNEVLDSYRLNEYDDIVCLFKFQEQWYGSIWQIQENELNLIDFKANSEASLSTLPQLVRDFHAKFFNTQPPSKGVVLLPDNLSYRVPVDRKDDDCGDLVMGFLYFYTIGSLLFEIKLTPPKRANFSLAFSWLLLKIYHEEEYQFKRNILSARPKKMEVSQLNARQKTAAKDVSSSSYEEQQQKQQKQQQDSQDGNDDDGQQNNEPEFDFADLLDGGGANLPKRQSVFKEIVRYTPMPKKQDADDDDAELAEDENNDEYRKKVVRSAKKILDSKEIEPYEFESSIYSVDTHNQKPTFNQQRLRTGNSRLNSNAHKDESRTEDDDANADWNGLAVGNRKKNKLKDNAMLGSHMFTSNSLSTQAIRKKHLTSSENILKKSMAVSGVLPTTSGNVGEDKKSIFSQTAMKSIAGIPPKMENLSKLSRRDVDALKNELLRSDLAQMQKQFVRKEDILDILQDVRQEVKMEMRLEMRKLAEDIKFEREKKTVEEEMRKKHFESYFMFLLDYYQKNDLKQYYQLLEEYNARLRGMTIANLPTRHPFALQPFQEQPGFNTSMNTSTTAGPGMYAQQSPSFGSGGMPPFTVTASAEQKLKDGFFNRGTMKYNSGNGNSGQQSIVYDKGLEKIEPKYLSDDNNFKNGNLKVPKPGEFRSPGVNGFAIQPDVAESYKNRVNMYMADSIGMVQQAFDSRNAEYKEQLRVARIMKSMEKYNGDPERGLKLFGANTKEKNEYIDNQVNQERKYQDLVKQNKRTALSEATLKSVSSKQPAAAANRRALNQPVLDEFGSAMPLLFKMNDVTATSNSKKKGTTVLLSGRRNSDDD